MNMNAPVCRTTTQKRGLLGGTSWSHAGERRTQYAHHSGPGVSIVTHLDESVRNTRQVGPICAVKKWIKPDINPNTGKAVRIDVHVKQGDTVKIISGKDKGKVGAVLKVYRKGLKAGKVSGCRSFFLTSRHEW